MKLFRVSSSGSGFFRQVLCHFPVRERRLGCSLQAPRCCARQDGPASLLQDSLTLKAPAFSVSLQLPDEMDHAGQHPPQGRVHYAPLT